MSGQDLSRSGNARRGVAQLGDWLIRLCFFSLLLFVAAPSRSEAGCVEAATLARSTASIVRHFGEQERAADSDVAGIAGTGWFLSRRLIVTAGHVVDAMRLSSRDWKDVEIRVGEDRESLPARILHVVGSGSEKIAVLELNSSFPGATALQIRLRPLVADEPILSLAYPGNERRVATGRFMRYGADDDRFAGMALLEMHDGNDRLVLDHGSSGAPAVDCEGRVVAVVTQAITQTMSFLLRVVRTSTAWQTPNVVAVPVAALEELARPE